MDENAIIAVKAAAIAVIAFVIVLASPIASVALIPEPIKIVITSRIEAGVTAIAVQISIKYLSILGPLLEKHYPCMLEGQTVVLNPRKRKKLVDTYLLAFRIRGSYDWT